MACNAPSTGSIHMSSNKPTLHLLCGKIAAGKSTLAAQLGNLPDTVVVSEDHWLSRLYPGEMTSVADYVRRSVYLRNAMGSHLADLLKSGVQLSWTFPRTRWRITHGCGRCLRRRGSPISSISSTFQMPSVRLVFGREMQTEIMSLRQQTSNLIS